MKLITSYRLLSFSLIFTLLVSTNLLVFSAAPVATNVNITTPSPFINGESVSGSYTWSDADAGDLDRSTFRWLKSTSSAGTSPTVISLETSQTLSSTASLRGYYISFEVTPKDNSGGPSGTVVQSSWKLVNSVPVANRDEYSGVSEGGSLTIATPGVLTNDADADMSQTLTISSYSPPKYGTATLNPNGRLQYTQNGTENFEDSLSYEITDSYEVSSKAWIRIHVTPVNEKSIADNESYTFDEGDAVIIVAAQGVLVGDTDPDGNALTAVLSGNTTQGVLNLNADGSFTYVHNGNSTILSDAFSYRAFDGFLYSDAATVTITINPVNDLPVLSNIEPSALAYKEGDVAVRITNSITLADEDNPSMTSARILISSNFDATEDVLAIPVTSGITTSYVAGLLTLTGTKTISQYRDILRSVTYLNTDNVNPNPNPRTIEFIINDGTAQSLPVTRIINVTSENNPPVALGETYNINEGDTLKVLAPGLLANDIDPEGVALIAADTRIPENSSSFILGQNGSFTYIHNGTETKRDSFKYKVYDGQVLSNEVTVKINITSKNDRPKAVNDLYELDEGALLTVPLNLGVRLNDSDEETLNSALTIALLTNFTVKYGKLNLSADGAFTYQHDSTENFTDRFSYTVKDALGLLDTAEVIFSIKKVNDPPKYKNLGEDTLDYTEDQLFIVIAPSLKLSDDDNTNLFSASVEITQNHLPTEDSLYIFQANVHPMSFSFNQTNGILTITGSAPYSEYEKALQKLRYKNINHKNPSEKIRRFTFTARDADAVSKPEYIHIRTKGVNDAPIAGDVKVKGVDLYIGEVLKGEYKFIDPDTDLEGVSKYKWYRANDAKGTGRELLLNDKINYTPIFTDGGKYLAFQVSPVDAKNLQGKDSLSLWHYIDAAPKLISPTLRNKINPGAFADDQTISVKYTYSDLENDAEGKHIYKWYISDSAFWRKAVLIPGEALDSIKIKSAYIEKYIGAKITPKALDGSTPGKTDSTSLYLISKLPSATISGVDTICNNGDKGTLTVTFTGTAPWNFTYKVNGGIPINVTGITIDKNPYQLKVSTLGTYELVSVRDAISSVGKVSGTGSIWYYKNPSALINGTISICNGDISTHTFNVNLTGKAPWSIYYSVNGKNPKAIHDITESPRSIPVSLESLGNYKIDSVVDKNTCTSPGLGSVIVQEKTNPVASISGEKFICDGDTGFFNVTINGTAPWTLKYEINGSLQDSLIITKPSYSLKASKEGEYKLTYLKDATKEGCVTGKAKMQLNKVPTASINGDDTICSGLSKTIEVALTGKAPFTFSYSYQGQTVDTIVGKYTNPYSLQVKKQGIYTIDTVIDATGCPGGRTTGSFELATIAPPTVTFSNLEEKYNTQTLMQDPIFFNVSPVGGKIDAVYKDYSLVFWFGDSTFVFIPRKRDQFIHKITYEYTDAETTCSTIDTALVTLIDSSGAIFPNTDLNICFNDAPFKMYPSYFGALPIGFELYRGKTEADIKPENKLPLSTGSSKDTIIVNPSEIENGPKLFVFNYIPTIANPNEKARIVQAYNFEKFEVDFSWNSDCYLKDNTITLLPNSTSGINYDLAGWSFPFIDTIIWNDSVSVVFPEKNKFDIKHFVTTDNNCTDTVIKPIELKSTIDLGLGLYYEEFENGNADWITTMSGNTNSWELNVAEEFGNKKVSPKVWHTNILEKDSIEQSYVLSPCFDFGQAKRPMIKMDIFRAFENGNDGAVLQYSLNNSNEWKNLGRIDEGVLWYDTPDINGKPGNQQIGWSTELVPSARKWDRAKHILDELIGQKNVRFRVAYGSDGKADQNLGFAFDNVWIGERNKTILVEHFTNASDTNSYSILASAKVNALANQYNSEVIDIQYHTPFPGVDEFYNQSQLSVNTRLLAYDLKQVPYSIIDGGKNFKDGYVFDWTNRTNYLEENDIFRAVLEDAPFALELDCSFGNNGINIHAEIRALKAGFNREISVKFAIIEDRVENLTGINGITKFESVLKTLISEQTGFINKTWGVGEYETIDSYWKLENVYDSRELRVVAFIQDVANQEIYQAAIFDPNNITSVNDVFEDGADISLNFFPNPVRDKAILNLSNYELGNAKIKIISSTGQLVYQNEITDFKQLVSLDFTNYQDGFYVLQLISDDKLIGSEKIILLKEK